MNPAGYPVQGATAGLGAAGYKRDIMTTKSLLPQAFWFRFAAPCTYLEKIPRPADPVRLLDLPAGCALPEWAQLERRGGMGRGSGGLE